MVDQKNKETPELTMNEAVEILSNIADLDDEVSSDFALEGIDRELSPTFRKVQWLHDQSGDKTVGHIKETFRVILKYLKDFFRRERGAIRNEQTIEGIKSVMILVGEAAKKLEVLADFFHLDENQKVTDFEEYKKLQDFYQRKISQKFNVSLIGKWLLELTKQLPYKQKEIKFLGKKKEESKHIFVDLDAVKKDTAYELFFIKKEDGSRFYSPRLLRNMKLVSEFGDTLSYRKEMDPLIDEVVWNDLYLHSTAKKLLSSMSIILEKYFQEVANHKKHPLVQSATKTIMALMLSANSNNLLEKKPLKTCSEYFYDFLYFLRETLHSKEYQKLVAYPFQEGNLMYHHLLNTIHGICRGLYLYSEGNEVFQNVIDELATRGREEQSLDHLEAAESSQMIWNYLAGDYNGLSKTLRKHPNGPLVKVMETLEEEGVHHAFDPILQGNIPNRYYSLYIQDHRVVHIRMPCPTVQETINKASISEEFIALLRALSHDVLIKKFLLVNLQERTSWQEYFRCKAVEELQFHPDFDEHLVVITLPKDTEFYHQDSPYRQEGHAHFFIKEFKNQILDENSGFYFPKSIKEKFSEEFLDSLLHTTHRIFFNERNVLTHQKRQDFIEIIYMLLVLKVLDVARADAFSLSCKDALDVGPMMSASIFAFFKLLQNSEITNEEIRQLNLIIHAPVLFHRERLVQLDRFNRIINMIRAVEAVKKEYQHDHFVMLIREAYREFFETSILNAEPQMS